MKGSGLTIMVREMHNEEKMTVSAIARELQMSRNTVVRKYLREDPQPDKRVGSKRPSKLDPFKPFIQELMQDGIYNSTVIFSRIKELGYEGGISILKNYLSPLRPPVAVKGEVRRRYETKPGAQVQMDWGLCHYFDSKGQKRKIACLVLILGYSRMRYIEFFHRCDKASMMRGIVNAFEYFGGVPQTLLTDNMKTVVSRIEWKKPVWQKEFEDFAAEIGFTPKLCRVRRPQTKGKVERSVHYVKDNFFPGRTFTDIADLNSQAMRWLEIVNNLEHGTTGMAPKALLEKEELKSLPEDGRHLDYKWETRRVSMDSFVSYDGVKYGVHYSYVDKTVDVSVDQNKIKIRFNGKVIQEHPYVRPGRKYVFAKNQYEGLQVKNYAVGTPKYARQIRQVEVATRNLEEYAVLEWRAK